MTKARAWILAVLLIVAWAAIPDGPASAGLPDTRVPACPEDAVLVGVGDFDNGRWTRVHLRTSCRRDYEGS